MTFRTHRVSNETFKNILNNVIEYFQSILIANQLLQKSTFIFVPPGTGNVLKIFPFLDQISRFQLSNPIKRIKSTTAS